MGNEGKDNYCLTKADLADAIYSALPVDKQKASQIVEDYIMRLKEEVFVTDKSKSLKVLYSPLHGTGGWIFEQVFAAQCSCHATL